MLDGKIIKIIILFKADNKSMYGEMKLNTFHDIHLHIGQPLTGVLNKK